MGGSGHRPCQGSGLPWGSCTESGQWGWGLAGRGRCPQRGRVHAVGSDRLPWTTLTAIAPGSVRQSGLGQEGHRAFLPALCAGVPCAVCDNPDPLVEVAEQVVLWAVWLTSVSVFCFRNVSYVSISFEGSGFMKPAVQCLQFFRTWCFRKCPLSVLYMPCC